MRNRWLFLIVMMLAGVIALPGCGDTAASDPDTVLSDEDMATADGALADDPSPEDGAIDAEPENGMGDALGGDPRYIIYLQPSPTSPGNPLFGLVSSFLARWPFNPWRNEAALLPPHVSMTGFFTAPRSQEQAIRDAIGDAIFDVGLPFGRPLLSSITRSKSSEGKWVVRLNVKHVPRYHRFINEVVRDLGIQGNRKRVANYHISLAVVPDKATANLIFADAKTRFPKSLLSALNTSSAGARWDIVLYRARDGIALGLDEIDRWRVNP